MYPIGTFSEHVAKVPHVICLQYDILVLTVYDIFSGVKYMNGLCDITLWAFVRTCIQSDLVNPCFFHPYASQSEHTSW